MYNSLNPQQKKILKGLAHSLKPVIHVGKEGLSDNVIKSINHALDDHELIKVQFLENAYLDRKKDSKRLAKLINAHLIQIIGFKITYYRFNPEKEKHISLL